jgi:hypothetical protein
MSNTMGRWKLFRGLTSLVDSLRCRTKSVVSGTSLNHTGGCGGGIHESHV